MRKSDDQRVITRPRKRPWIPYIAPTLLIMAVLFLLPLVFVTVISLTNYKLGMSFGSISFIGASNYRRLFTGQESSFYHSVFITIGFMVFGTLLQLVFGMICALLGLVGDLSASLIKRQTGIKDYGNIMPGHGGVMDRFDSVIIVAPFMYYVFSMGLIL